MPLIRIRRSFKDTEIKNLLAGKLTAQQASILQIRDPDEEPVRVSPVIGLDDIHAEVRSAVTVHLAEHHSGELAARRNDSRLPDPALLVAFRAKAQFLRSLVDPQEVGHAVAIEVAEPWKTDVSAEVQRVLHHESRAGTQRRLEVERLN